MINGRQWLRRECRYGGEGCRRGLPHPVGKGVLCTPRILPVEQKRLAVKPIRATLRFKVGKAGGIASSVGRYFLLIRLYIAYSSFSGAGADEGSAASARPADSRAAKCQANGRAVHSDLVGTACTA